jgi:hypothetical protein
MLTSMFIIYVGSEKDGYGGRISARETGAMSRTVEREACKRFGGYSKHMIKGGWLDDAGRLIKERSFRYEIVTDRPVEEVMAWAELARTTFKQNTVIVSRHTTEMIHVTGQPQTVAA